jgi:hypothetical protein
MRKRTGAYRVFRGAEGQTLFGRLNGGWENNIKMVP